MPVQQRAAETRQKLVDAAVRLFAATGYNEISPQDVAAAADLTTGAFYYHFASKEALAAAIIDHAWPAIAQEMNSCMNADGPMIENVIRSVFAISDLVNRDELQWVGFHLNMAIGHLGPTGRRAYRDRVEAHSSLLAGAFGEAQLRPGVSREHAGDLLWIALAGNRLLSDVFHDTGSAHVERLVLACKSALRAIVPDGLLPSLEDFVDETAARYTPDESRTAMVSRRVA